MVIHQNVRGLICIRANTYDINQHRNYYHHPLGVLIIRETLIISFEFLVGGRAFKWEYACIIIQLNVSLSTITFKIMVCETSIAFILLFAYVYFALVLWEGMHFQMNIFYLQIIKTLVLWTIVWFSNIYAIY